MESSRPSFPDANLNIGMRSWFRNFFNTSFKNYKAQDLASVTCPYHEYLIFCTFKTVQMASFIGGILIRPIYHNYYEKKLTPEKTTNNSLKIIRDSRRRLQGRILIASFFVSPLVMWASIKYHGYNREKLALRCYQIRCDSDIINYDRATLFLGLLGWYWKRFQGAVDFINIALFYSIFHVRIAKNYLNPVNLNFADLKGLEKYSNIEEAEFEGSELYRFARDKLKRKEGSSTE